MLFLSLLLAANVVPLTVVTDQPRQFTPAELLRRPDQKEVDVEVPGLGGPQTFTVVPLSGLLSTLSKDVERVDVACADGFVAILSRAAVDNRDPSKPIAYLAVQRDIPWPKLRGSDLGPYMVVWTVSAGQTVPRELWPYQVVKLSASIPAERRYPRLAPKGRMAKAGFGVFVQNCLPCHPLNGEGPARVGPDLNQPHSPIEYLGSRRLTAYVRDPQSLHVWPAARMPSFPESVLSDADLAELLTYLRDRASAR